MRFGVGGEDAGRGQGRGCCIGREGRWGRGEEVGKGGRRGVGVGWMWWGLDESEWGRGGEKGRQHARLQPRWGLP